MHKLRGLNKLGAVRNIKLNELKKMKDNQYRFSISIDKEGNYILVCETTFEYKGKAYKIDNKRVLEDFHEGVKIDPKIQQDAIKEINEEINNFKLTN